MRKITKNAVSSLLAQKNFKHSNTEVQVLGFTSYLLLHNNNIAIYTGTKDLYITNCGWFTNTTKERLNALPNVRIQQKKFKWYLNGKEWDGKMTKINNN
jgi:hypothetical protein